MHPVGKLRSCSVSNLSPVCGIPVSSLLRLVLVVENLDKGPMDFGRKPQQTCTLLSPLIRAANTTAAAQGLIIAGINMEKRERYYKFFLVATLPTGMPTTTITTATVTLGNPLFIFIGTMAVPTTSVVLVRNETLDFMNYRDFTYANHLPNTFNISYDILSAVDPKKCAKCADDYDKSTTSQLVSLFRNSEPVQHIPPLKPIRIIAVNQRPKIGKNKDNALWTYAIPALIIFAILLTLTTILYILHLKKQRNEVPKWNFSDKRVIPSFVYHYNHEMDRNSPKETRYKKSPPPPKLNIPPANEFKCVVRENLHSPIARNNSGPAVNPGNFLTVDKSIDMSSCVSNTSIYAPELDIKDVISTLSVREGARNPTPRKASAEESEEDLSNFTTISSTSEIASDAKPTSTKKYVSSSVKSRDNAESPTFSSSSGGAINSTFSKDWESDESTGRMYFAEIDRRIHKNTDKEIREIAKDTSKSPIISENLSPRYLEKSKLPPKKNKSNVGSSTGSTSTKSSKISSGGSSDNTKST
ncbi:unnamed protein product [Gordionus sp. m RMFG-2023]